MTSKNAGTPNRNQIRAPRRDLDDFFHGFTVTSLEQGDRRIALNIAKRAIPARGNDSQTIHHDIDIGEMANPGIGLACPRKAMRDGLAILPVWSRRCAVNDRQAPRSPSRRIIRRSTNPLAPVTLEPGSRPSRSQIGVEHGAFHHGVRVIRPLARHFGLRLIHAPHYVFPDQITNH